MFCIFIYFPEVKVGDLVSPSCAQTWRMPLPSSNSISALSPAALSKHAHGITVSQYPTQDNFDAVELSLNHSLLEEVRRRYWGCSPKCLRYCLS